MFGLKLINQKDYTHLLETVTEYSRALEDAGWINLSLDSGSALEDVIKNGFENVIKRCRLFYYNNPIAGHWVDLTTWFTFGEGIAIPKAKDNSIAEVIETFWNDPDNVSSITGYQAQETLSNKLQYEGNLYFVLFADEEGLVRVRVMDALQVSDIIYDPEDNTRPIFYKVKTNKQKYNFASDSYDFSAPDFVYYADKDVYDINEYKIPKNKLVQDARIYHVKINTDLKFGVPDLYRGIDWMRAHKDMAQDLATLIKSLSRFAWKKKIKGTSAQVNKFKAAMNSKSDMSNRAPATGSTQIENQGVDLQSVDIKTGGVDIGSKGLRQMLLMSCAASGIFEHYFGDPSTGNLATAKSMELPMIKKFIARQTLFRTVYRELLMYCIKEKVSVGLLSGMIDDDAKMRRRRLNTNLDLTIDIDFPPVIEEDLKPLGEALEIAKRAGLISDDTAARIFLLGANQNELDEEIEKLNIDKEAKEKKEAEKFNQTVQLQQIKAKPAIPVKETIEAPGRGLANRFVRKSDFMKQRTNGYARAIAGNFKLLRDNIKKNIVVSGVKGRYLGDVKKLDNILEAFAHNMITSGDKYIAEAVKIGSKYLQAHLDNKVVEASLYEAGQGESALVRKLSEENEKYVTRSLTPSIKESVMKKVRDTYESERDFHAAVNQTVLGFEPRLEQYAGFFWRAEEEAVKEAGRGTGLMVNFVGADDEQTCEGCEAAMAGNPWSIDEAPVPGTLDCLTRCRHALQIIE